MGDLFSKVGEFFGNLGKVNTVLSDLKDKVNSVDFAENTIVNTFFGNIRYLIGDTNYMLIMTLLGVGLGFLIFKLSVYIYSHVRKI